MFAAFACNANFIFDFIAPADMVWTKLDRNQVLYVFYQYCVPNTSVLSRGQNENSIFKMQVQNEYN